MKTNFYQKLWIISMLFLWSLSITASGAVVSNLYSARVPVTKRSVTQKKQAMIKGFKSVLVRVSGDAQITHLPTIHAQLSHAADYIQTFHYISTQKPPTLFLEMIFDKISVNKLLQQNAQPIWGQNRPLTLVWLVLKKDDAIEWDNSENQDSLTQKLTQMFEERGIPVLFPMFDMADVQHITPEDVWQNQFNTIDFVSKRYSPDITLIISIDNTDENNLVGHWTLRTPDELPKQWQINSQSVDDFLTTGTQTFIDELLKRFLATQDIGQAHMITLSVENINSIDAYVHLMQYLQSLTDIAKIDVRHITAQQVDIQLVLETSIKTLEKTIQLDSVLTPIESLVDIDEESTILHYQFNTSSQHSNLVSHKEETQHVE